MLLLVYSHLKLSTDQYERTLCTFGWVIQSICVAVGPRSTDVTLDTGACIQVTKSTPIINLNLIRLLYTCIFNTREYFL